MGHICLCRHQWVKFKMGHLFRDKRSIIYYKNLLILVESNLSRNSYSFLIFNFQKQYIGGDQKTCFIQLIWRDYKTLQVYPIIKCIHFHPYYNVASIQQVDVIILKSTYITIFKGKQLYPHLCYHKSTFFPLLPLA